MTCSLAESARSASTVVLSVLAATGAGAQQFAPGQILTGHVSSPRDVHLADVDGDGDLDVLSASFEDDRIAWYPNLDGEGSFQLQRVVATDADGASDVFTADLDGDGDLDLIASSYLDDRVAWYENLDGSGNFSSAHPITTSLSGAAAVWAADLDGDLDADVLACGDTAGLVVWFENLDGQGTFGSAKIVADNLVGPLDVVAHDLDGDDALDVLAAAYWDGEVVWMKNIGGGSAFSDPQPIMTLDGPRSLAVEDVNGDDRPDVLVAAYRVFSSGKFTMPVGEVAWVAGTDGAGSFGGKSVITTQSDFSQSIGVADLNGDRMPDVVLASAFETFPTVWFENEDGLGGFGAPQSLSVSAGFVAAGDLDGDGDADVVGLFDGTYYAGRVGWLENLDGAATFGPELPVTTEADAAYAAATADLDGDGDVDVLSASWLDDKIAWYENLDGCGSFGLEQVVTDLADGARDVTTADLDGDGDPDVVSAASLGNEVAWYENLDGTNAFGAKQPISTDAFQVISVRAADVDGDLDQDLVAALTSSATIVWYENLDGLGTFGAAVPVATGLPNLLMIRAADLDGDGDPDLVAAQGFLDFTDTRITWFENLDGAGTFGTANVVTEEVAGQLSIEVGDVDGDRDLDVVSSSWTSISGLLDHRVAWYENTDGDGTFGPQQVVASAPMYPADVELADVNEDGDPDLIVIAGVLIAASAVTWHENLDGEGAFGPAQTITTDFFQPRAVVADDLDGDGDPDVLTVSSQDNRVAWYENGGCASAWGAVELVRLGTPPNPFALLPGQTSGPVVGCTWDPVIDHASFLPGATVDFLAVSAGPLNANVPPYGTVLCTPALLVFLALPGTPFEVALQDTCSTVGVSLCTQGASWDGVNVLLTNALDITIGSF